MADSGVWYLKMNDGTVYGPADLNRLQTWAREGRVAPSSQISSDRKSWIPASQMPELGMEWVVEVEQGQYYGPFHPDVVRDLIAQKRVPASARRFKLDTGRAQEDHSKELNAALEKAKSSLAEKDAALAEQKSLVAEKEALIAELKAALVEQKTLIAGLRNQEAGLSAKLEKSQKESESATAASASRIEELETALKKEHARAEELAAALKAERAHTEELAAALAKSKSEAEAERVRVENLLAQLVSAAEREKTLRADLDLAHKTAASERKCVEAAIRRERQTAKELEGARKEVEDLQWTMMSLVCCGPHAETGFVSDPDACAGKAWYNAGFEPKPPQTIGLYNSLDTSGKKNSPLTFMLPDDPKAKEPGCAAIPQDEKFHLYRIDRRIMQVPLYIHFDGNWTFRHWFGTVGIVPEERDVWVSVKFTGPDFVKGSTQPNRMLFDRILLVK